MMDAPDMIGRPATVRASDVFYQYIDGWKGLIIGFESGLVLLEVAQNEAGLNVKKVFYLPADQLEVDL